MDSSDRHYKWEFGQLSPWDEGIQAAATSAALATNKVRAGDLMPDWQQQTLRSVVPCQGSQKFHWRRSCRCTTLGRLFGMLGQDFPAAVLYHFYRTRRIVVVKARKG